MLDKEKLIEGLEMAKDVIDLWIPMFEQRSAPAFIEEAIAVLKTQPQIVRCKDCCTSEIRLKRSCTPYDDGGWQRYCPNIRGWVDDDWFCADGEPKDGDGE